MAEDGLTFFDRRREISFSPLSAGSHDIHGDQYVQEGRGGRDEAQQGEQGEGVDHQGTTREFVTTVTTAVNLVF